jgi:uncharacterized membrane protein
MEPWIKYSVLIAVFYTLWTILWEFLIKKNSSKCFCLSLKVYIMAGVIAFLFLIFHVKNKCDNHDTISDIFKEKKSVYVLFVIIAICMLLANYFWIKAVNTDKNVGYISSIANLYVIMVTLFSAYKYSYKVTIKHVIGILIILFGTHLIMT